MESDTVNRKKGVYYMDNKRKTSLRMKLRYRLRKTTEQYLNMPRDLQSSVTEKEIRWMTGNNMTSYTIVNTG